MTVKALRQPQCSRRTTSAFGACRSESTRLAEDWPSRAFRAWGHGSGSCFQARARGLEKPPQILPIPSSKSLSYNRLLRTAMITILIVDDHPIMRVGIAAIIGQCNEMKVIGY